MFDYNIMDSESRSDKFLKSAMAAGMKRGVVAPVLPAVKPVKGRFDDMLRAAAEKKGIAYAPPAPLPKSGKTVYMTGDTMAAQRQEDPALRRWETRLMLDKRAKAYASGRRTMDELIREQEKGYMKINRPTMGSKIRDLFRGTVGAKIGV